MSAAMRFAPAFAEPAGSPIRELFPYLQWPGMISLAGGYPSVDLLDEAGLRDAATQAFGTAGALQYGATEGVPALREALAQLCAGRGLDCEPGELLVTSGSQQALELLLRILLQPGDVVLVESPAYPAALQALRQAGARVVEVPTDAQGLQVDALRACWPTLPGRPRLLYTVPTFCNPTGASLSGERRAALVQFAVAQNLTVVEDDPYGDLRFDDAPQSTLHSIGRRLAGQDNPVIFLSSLSKTMAPSLRIGWMVAPPAVLRRAAIAKQTGDLCTSPLTQLIAAHYLASGRHAGTVARASAVYAQRMQALAGALTQAFGDRLRFSRPDGGLFLWAHWDAAVLPAAPARVFDAAVQAGVLFVPGRAFYLDDTPRTSLRLSFASSGPDLLREGVRRLAQAFETETVE